MIFASSPARSCTYSAASLASISVMSPEMLMITWDAPAMVVSSRGLATACLTASRALSSPLPCPIPIWAIPLSVITVCTSAKSRLISEGTLIRSVIPWIPCWRTSSAFLSASGIVVLLSTISRSLSFGITISVSTFSFNFSIPARALFILVLDSNLKGLVTTPTVSAPCSLAIRATTGVAPVPVPPPIPQVTNTISAPLSADWISSALSSAAFSPISGLAPAPRPFVSLSPICIRVGALHNWRACLSVLIAINSTPAICSSIMRLTALFPPPPTPTTIILAAASDSFVLISNKSFSSFVTLLYYTP